MKLNFKKAKNYLTLAVVAIACSKNDPGPAAPCAFQTPDIYLQIVPPYYNFSWKKVAGANYYQLDCLLPTGALGTRTLAKTDTFAIVPMNSYYPGTTYQAYLYVQNTDNQSDNSCDGRYQSFDIICGPLTNFTFSSITSTSAIFSWQIGSSVSSYKPFTVGLRKKGTTEVTQMNSNQHQISLTNLSPATTYQVQVAFTCYDQTVYTSAWTDFSTN